MTEPTPTSRPHPYIHLAYGPWEPSGHQCWDLKQGGCDEPIDEREVIVTDVDGTGIAGWELRDCPSCAPRPDDVPDELAAVLPAHERQVRERVAAELREDADAHRRVVARKPTEYDEARLARARTLDDAASRITRMRGES